MITSQQRYTTRPFADALNELLERRGSGTDTRVNLGEFLRRVEGWREGTLRKQIASERTLQAEAVKAIAEALNVAPEYFLEYRRHQINQAVQVHPELVDLVYDLLVSRARSIEAMTVPFVTTALDLLVDGKDIDAGMASKVLEMIMEGKVSDVQATAFLTALRTKGESAEEIVGLARTMRKYGTPVDLGPGVDALDIVSTGGDHLASFNVSTTASFVAAAAGVVIAKHGNRGQTSRAGAADLLQGLGARIDLPPQAIAQCVREVGFGFMFAPLHYKATRNLATVRRILGIRTIFNFLGPILNPAGVKRQLTGVSEARFVPVLAEALAQMGSTHAMLVHGENGLDEISISGDTLVVEVKNGVCGAPFVINPEMFGLERFPSKSVFGGSLNRNVEITRRVLAGEPGPPLDIVLLNAGAAIYLAGVAADITEGIEKAREAVLAGKAWDKMAAFVECTHTSEAGATDEAWSEAGTAT
jgi:anthranilate phosphoribosyltransferase